MINNDLGGRPTPHAEIEIPLSFLRLSIREATADGPNPKVLCGSLMTCCSMSWQRSDDMQVHVSWHFPERPPSKSTINNTLQLQETQGIHPQMNLSPILRIPVISGFVQRFFHFFFFSFFSLDSLWLSRNLREKRCKIRNLENWNSLSHGSRFFLLFLLFLGGQTEVCFDVVVWISDVNVFVRRIGTMWILCCWNRCLEMY